MQLTRNYNFKKPDYTDFADIKDINENMDKIDEELAAPTGDTADSKATFTCSDVSDGDAAAWTNVPALTSGETHKSIFAKMSQMFKNLRYLYKLLGTTDISSIGNGTVTGGLSSLNDSLSQKAVGKNFSLLFNTTLVQFAIRLNPADFVYKGTRYVQVQAVIVANGSVAVQGIRSGGTSWETLE